LGDTATTSPTKRRRRALEHSEQAPLVDHLTELRSRIFYVVGALVVAFAVCYFYRDTLFALLARPLDGKYEMQTLGVTEPLFTSITVAAQTAFVIIIPVLLWHVWRFIRPAIDPHARRTIATLLIAAPAMFAAGVLFGYFFVLTPAIQVLLGLGPDSIDVVVRASDYYSFVAMTLLAIGAAFCFPLVLLGLSRVGLITAAQLRAHRKLALLGIVILAALLPTADPVSLVLEVLPLLALYELSIIVIDAQERSLARRARREASMQDAV
jgi:sec-independent protein translocase protein TatC